MKPYQRERQIRRERARAGLTMLDCWFCGLNCRDFTELAAHVKREHDGETQPRPGVSPVNHGRTKASSSTMAKSSRRGNDDRREFLRAADLPRKGTTIIKLGNVIRTFKGDYGVQLVIECEVNGHEYDFGVKVNGANHIALEKKLGRNLIAWSGKTIKATVAQFDSDEGRKDYIELEGAGDREGNRRRERD
jgi:hypothetical protein